MDWRRKVSKFSKITIALAIAFATAFSLVPTSAQAFGGGMIGGANAARGSDQPSDLFGQAGIFSTITNVMLFIVGGVSVLMIIIGGLRYVLSGGDSGNVSAAKNTILYAIVGIIVSLLAYDENQCIKKDGGMMEFTLDRENKTVTLKLRSKDYKWSDGQPLTIDDYIFTYEFVGRKDYDSLLNVKIVELKKICHEPLPLFFLPIWAC